MIPDQPIIYTGTDAETIEEACKEAVEILEDELGITEPEIVIFD